MTRVLTSLAQMRSSRAFSFLLAALLVTGRLPAATPLVIENLDGPVTSVEIQAFKSYLREVPVPVDNTRNMMVYGPAGQAVETLGLLLEITGDVEFLDRMLVFTDAMLAARNNPQTGAILWTGERELVWPNAKPQPGRPLFATTETGDVAGHIAYAAKLILQREPLWKLPVPDGDPHRFGATYRERAVRYLRELDRTMDSFVLKWLVRPGTLRYYTPDSPLYDAATKPGSRNQPVPWNQQMMLNNGFQRLAEAHALLGDDAGRVKRYEAIVQASVDWFFSNAERVTVKGHPCYRWAYVFEEPLKHIEDYGHGGEDIEGLYRAYRSGRYGITGAMMAPFANTVIHVMRTPEGRFIPRVDGKPAAADRAPGGLRGPWVNLAEFAPELLPMIYEVNRARIKSSPDVVAAILWQKHRRAKQ